jgi:hypothetical protein
MVETTTIDPSKFKSHSLFLGFLAQRSSAIFLHFHRQSPVNATEVHSFLAKRPKATFISILPTDISIA